MKNHEETYIDESELQVVDPQVVDEKSNKETKPKVEKVKKATEKKAVKKSSGNKFLKKPKAKKQLEENYEDERTDKSERDEKKDEKEIKKSEPLLSGFMGRLIIVLGLLIIMMFAVKFLFFSSFGTKKTVTSILLEQKLEACSELVVLKYKYRDVVVPTASLGLAKSYAIVRFDGIIRIGIRDITQCDIEVYNDGKGVRIRLPFIEVLGNEISEQEVIDELKSVFAPTTIKDVVNEINERKDDVLKELIDENIYEEARRNAVAVVTQMVQAMGFEEYEIDCQIEEYLKPQKRFEIPEEQE